MRKIIAIILILVLALSCTACGSSMKESMMSPQATLAPAYKSEVYDEAYDMNTNEYTADIVATTDRIIIYTYNVSMRVGDLETAINEIKNSLPETAWIDSMEQSSRNGNICLRIESGSAQSFVDSMDNFGKVTNKSQSSDDVTDSYNNADQKIQILEIEQERLIDLLKVASVSDSIEINTRLSQIEISLRSLYGELKTYESLAKYSTVTINLYTEAVQIQDGFFARLGDALGDSWESFQSLIIVVIALGIYIVPIGVVVFFIVRAIKKKKSNKKNQVSKDSE